MLNTLRTMLEQSEDFVSNEYDLADAQNDSDSIKDRFLDDPSVVVIGAENDPVIKQIIKSLPESDDISSVAPDSLNRIIESTIPESKLLSGRYDFSFEYSGQLNTDGAEDESEDVEGDCSSIDDVADNVDGDMNDMIESLLNEF